MIRLAPPSIPLLPIAAGFAAGIVLRLAGVPFLWACPMAIVAALLAIAKQNHLAAVTAAIFLGQTCASFNVRYEPTAALIDFPATLQGEVVDMTIGDNSRSLTVDIRAVATSDSLLSDTETERVRLIIPGLEPDVEAGDIITTRATLRRVTVRTDLPDERDPAQTLLDKHIYLTAFITPDSIFDIHPYDGFMAKMRRARNHLSEMILTSRLSTSAKEFFTTALIGDSSVLPADTRSAFAAAGLSHLLALSGLHVGLIAMLIAFALWPLNMVGARSIGLVITVVALWLYALISGLGPSVTRAVIMSTVFISARLLQRKSSPYNSLCLASLIILIINPLALITAGFQLTFAAVLGILLFAKRLNPISQRRRLAYNSFALISVSLSAMLGTAVIAIVYYHSFPVYFLLANVVSSIFLLPLMSGAVILLLLQWLSIPADWLCSVINLVYSLMSEAVEWISSMPGASVGHIYISPYIVVPYAAALALLKTWLSTKGTLSCLAKYGCGAAILVVAAGFIFRPEAERIPRLYIARTTYHTELIADSNDGILRIFTTLPQEHLQTELRAELRYRDYIQRRGIDSIAVAGLVDSTAPGIALTDSIVAAGRSTIAVVCSNLAADCRSRKVDYALVCRGFRGSIESVASAFSPDTIILSTDLHPLRAKRYADECRQLNLPAIDMRRRPFNLPLTR